MIQHFFTAALIKSNGLSLTGKIIEKILDSGSFTIARAEPMTLSREQINSLYGAHMGMWYFDDLVDSVDHGVLAMALEGNDAVRIWRDLMGPPDPKSPLCQPHHIRWLARHQPRMIDNLVHGSDSANATERELTLLFGDSWVSAHYGRAPHPDVYLGNGTLREVWR